MPKEFSEPDLETLREALAGEALIPGDAGWDGARMAWNLAADQHPAAIVMAETADDVAAAVRFARDQELRVAPQNTGHGATSLGDLSDAVLLRLARMTDVTIDAGAKTARLEAGAQWNDVVGQAVEHGLTALHGSSGTVGSTGYLLSGGLSWLARSRGLACNSVRAFEVVTADGETRRVDSDNDTDLFWALRGGGGEHAIVTAAEIELVELREAYAGSLMWPLERAADVAQAWREWSADLPDEMATTLKLLRFPPMPIIPEPLRGRSLVGVTFVYAGGEEEGSKLLADLGDLGDPYLDTSGVVPAAALAVLAGDPVDPIPARGGGILLNALEEETIDAFVELAGPDVDVPLIFLELRRLGGALERSDPSHGALDVLKGPYIVYGVGAVMGPEAADAIGSTLDGIFERLAPWTAVHTPLGFAEQQPGWRASFDEETAERLAAIKADHDPDNLILSNHGAD